MVEELGTAATKEGTGRLLAAFKRAQKEVHIAQVSSLEQFQAQFQALIEQHIAPRRLVVLVDDLDRCLPQKAIDVLEAIKLFLDARGCVFVLGLDREVITHAIRVKYRDMEGCIDGERYLEKIVQLQFDLPPLEPEDVRGYVDSLAPCWPDARCRDVFAAGLGRPNPRRIKRTVNSYLFLSRVARERVDRLGELKPVRLAKVVAIQHGNPALHQLLSGAPGYLADLELHYRDIAQRGEGASGEAKATPIPLPEALQAMANSEALRSLLLLCANDEAACFARLTPAEIRPYFTLVRSIAAPQTAAAAPLPVPQMAPIPEGEFLRGTSDEEVAWLIANTDWAKEWKEKGYFIAEQPQRSIHLSAYQIGRFPVTNVEYQAFVQATGRQPPQHWNGDAAPEQISDHPVTYVHYDDALAYCAWLSERTGASYRLPTEAEWEKAARGADGRQYPWGNTFDSARCNTDEGKVGGTTPVGQYSQAGGDSPYGCADMAGNVWEWCLDWYTSEYYAAAPGRDPAGPPDGQTRVVRGGSWDNDQRFARCAYRGWNCPGPSPQRLGFRVVVAPPISPRR